MANTVWILIAVVVPVVLIAATTWAGRRQGDAHRRIQANEIRKRLREEDARMRHYETIAAETEALAEQAERLQAAPD